MKIFEKVEKVKLHLELLVFLNEFLMVKIETNCIKSLKVQAKFCNNEKKWKIFKDLCKENGVSGYPTFKLFRNGKPSGNYPGGRKKNDFISGLESFATTISKSEL